MAITIKEIRPIPPGMYKATLSDAEFDLAGIFGPAIKCKFDLQVNGEWEQRTISLNIKNGSFTRGSKTGRWLPILLNCQDLDAFLRAYGHMDEHQLADALAKAKPTVWLEVKLKDDGTKNVYDNIAPFSAENSQPVVAPARPAPQPAAAPPLRPVPPPTPQTAQTAQPARQPVNRTESQLDADIEAFFGSGVTEAPPPLTDTDAPDQYGDV